MSKNHFLFIIMGVILFMSLSTIRGSNRETVVVNPEKLFQRFEGWGTSLCWFGNVIGGWPDQKRNAIADLIFSRDNLGFNIARYNIGGGENPSCRWNKKGKQSHLRFGAAIPGYKAGKNQGYNWDADANQRWMLLAAKSRGANLFEAFSNSPPYWMTNSQCVSGAANAIDNNLNDSYYDAFADYLTEVVKHFRDTWGIIFRTLDPLNEPASDFWFAGHNQEGCHFDIDQQSLIITKTAASLAAKGLATEISASDENDLNQAIATFNGLDDNARKCIRQINVHSYNGWQRTELRDLAASHGKRLWMSEYGVGIGSHDHRAMDSSLQLAQIIHADLVDLGAGAWVYWQAVENEQGNGNWGLIHADFESPAQGYYLTKQYYAMANFSRFIRPGYRIIESGDRCTVAAMDPTGQKLVLVTYNTDTNDQEFVYDLSKFNMVEENVDIYTTSINQDLAHSMGAIRNKFLTVPLPARAIVTVVINIH